MQTFAKYQLMFSYLFIKRKKVSIFALISLLLYQMIRVNLIENETFYSRFLYHLLGDV